MAGPYQLQGGDIGTLLRMIQDEKASNPVLNTPATDPNSPIRAQVQGPLLAPEAPGGTRNVSIRPEGIGTLGPAEASSGQVVAPMVQTPRIGPVTAPTIANKPGGGAPVPTPVPTPTPRSSAPAIGTRITPTQSVLGKSTQSRPATSIPTPTRPRIGVPIVNPQNSLRPAPTVTPVQQQQQGGRNTKPKTGHISYLA